MIDSSYPSRTDSGNNENATIRSLFLEALSNVLRGQEAKLDVLLDENGFFRSQITSPYERVPLRRFVSLIESASARFRRPFLGIEMGERFGLTELGPFHALFSSAVNLRDAMEIFARFQSRWQTRTFLGVDRSIDVTTYSYRITDQAIWPRRQDAEFTIAGLVTLVKQLWTPKWSPVEVQFEHSIAGREHYLRQFFRAPVYGAQSSNRLGILNEDLDRPLPHSFYSQGDRLKTILEAHLLDLMRIEITPPKSTAEQIAEIITRRLGQASVDCDVIASDLNLSVRSLRRRLVEEGTSFRRVLQETRQERAKVMLEDMDMPVAAAARVLGYSDTATFSRAFKQWTGAPPRRYGRKEA